MIALSVMAACTVLAAAVPPAAAQPAGPPPGAAPPPTPKLDVETFRFLIGRWRGHGTFMGGKPFSSTIAFSVANSKAIEVRFAEDAPDTYAYVALWGREPITRRLVMLMASSLDGPALFKSDGWVGDKLVFEPDPGVHPAPGAPRFTYLKTGPDSFDLIYEFGVNGAWYVGDKQSFTREK